MRPNWILIPLVTIGVMLLSRVLMMGSWQWYLSLRLPVITPPRNVIGDVWQLIYICTTACVLLVYNIGERTSRFWYSMVLFIFTTALHLCWIYLFFHQHFLGLATLCAAFLCFLLCLLVILLWPVSIFCAFLMIPHAAWVGFMAILNAWIWLIN
jgi:benzodiazapine receptor